MVMNFKSAICCVLCLIFTMVSAQAVTVDATVMKVIGNAYAVLPGTQDKVPLKEGMKLPPGTVVTTEAGALVSLNLLPGAASVITGNSEMKIGELSYGKTEADNREIKLNLKKGGIFSSLKSSGTHTDFRVETPFGVAAARGTSWEVLVDGAGGSVRTYNHTVILTLSDGTTFEITSGHFIEIKDGHAVGDPKPLTQEQIDAIKKLLADAGFTVTTTNTGTGGLGGNNNVNFNPANLDGQVQSPETGGDLKPLIR